MIAIKLIDSLYCIEHGDRLAAVDHHILPVALGGTKVVPLCEECHHKIHEKKKTNPISNSELTKLGMKKAKEAGRVFGARKKVTKINRQLIYLFHLEGFSLRTIAKKIGISHSTVKKEIEAILVELAKKAV